VTECTKKPIGLFYHIWCPAGTDIWRILVDEQIKRIDRSGLRSRAGIHCCISGPQHADIRRYVAEYKWINILQSTADESTFEGLTLGHLYEWCCNDPHAKYAAYVHTKGIRHFPTAGTDTLRAINSWRHMLEWGVIDRWRDAVKQLASADVAGINFRPDPRPHFSGNFWWANVAYVRRLPHPVAAAATPVAYIDGDAATLRRVTYEMWVGLGDPLVFSFGDFPWGIDGKDWTYGFDMYRDDVGHSYLRL
jgi:hypothetical protein